MPIKDDMHIPQWLIDMINEMDEKLRAECPPYSEYLRRFSLNPSHYMPLPEPPRED